MRTSILCLVLFATACGDSENTMPFKAKDLDDNPSLQLDGTRSASLAHSYWNIEDRTLVYWMEFGENTYRSGAMKSMGNGKAVVMLTEGRYATDEDDVQLLVQRSTCKSQHKTSREVFDYYLHPDGLLQLTDDSGTVILRNANVPTPVPIDAELGCISAEGRFYPGEWESL